MLDSGAASRAHADERPHNSRGRSLNHLRYTFGASLYSCATWWVLSDDIPIAYVLNLFSFYRGMLSQQEAYGTAIFHDMAAAEAQVALM
jgi:hypothetical protein